MPPRSVVLIGFMGAGKSRVGAALAERLGYRLFDTDAWVEERAGMTIPEIFAREGEEGFRSREARACTQAARAARRVVACGGGAVLNLASLEALRRAGPIVYLRTSPEELRARLGSGEGRPLLAEGLGAEFDRLLAERAPAYEAAADVTIDTDGKDPEAVAGEIAEAIA